MASKARKAHVPRDAHWYTRKMRLSLSRSVASVLILTLLLGAPGAQAWGQAAAAVRGSVGARPLGTAGPIAPAPDSRAVPSLSLHAPSSPLSAAPLAAQSPAPAAGRTLTPAGAAAPDVPTSPDAHASLNLLARPQNQEKTGGTFSAVYDAARSDGVRNDYADFLVRIGFEDYSSQISRRLKSGRRRKLQTSVLTFNQQRYRVFNAARELAAEVMAGLAEQKNSRASMKTATELAARLLSLQPLDPPSTLPPDIAAKDQDGIVDWLAAVTVQRVGQQLAQVVSDVVKTIVAPQELTRRTSRLRRPNNAADKAFLQRVARVKALSETLLLTAYTDGEIGQTRYAGRALAASLVRFSRREGRPEVETTLRRKVAERGLHLENFVGDTLILRDVADPSKPLRLKVENGDFLGERSSGREAAEITFAVRPAWSLTFKAWREGLTGRFLGLWANPKSSPRLVPGQTLRNNLKLALWKLKKWVAARPIMERGYSHAGMARVQEADGVAMAWALDNYPNAEEGGIRKIGITEQFAQNGPYMRLGLARWDPDRLWEDFRAQTARNGYRKRVWKAEAGSWPTAISAKDFAALTAIPKSRSAELLREINARAVSVIEDMLARYGVGFAYGFSNEMWRAYCSATLMLGHRMGSQFEPQAEPDRWHTIMLLMKFLGIGDAKEQDTQSRIIWPGSFFVDPKVSRHVQVRFPPFTEVGRVPDPNTVPAYVEMDRELTRSLSALLQLSDEGGIEPDGGLINQAVRAHLDTRTKGRQKRGYHSGSSGSSGYSAGLEDLLRDGEDE